MLSSTTTDRRIAMMASSAYSRRRRERVRAGGGVRAIGSFDPLGPGPLGLCSRLWNAEYVVGATPS